MLRLFSRRGKFSTGEHVGVEYAAIPRLEIPDLAREYIAAMETEESAQWCKCLWRIHPDDVNIAMGDCRECGQAYTADIHNFPAEKELDDGHSFRGVRKKRIDDHPECPVHTKEGLLIHFVEWVTKR